MISHRVIRLFACVLFLLGAAVACKSNNDVTGTGGALARLQLDAPDSVGTGQAFNVDVKALNVGVTNVQSGVVQITLPAPLSVDTTDASAGTATTFSHGASGATVTWNLNTLDSNTQSTLRIGTTGVLPAGSASMVVRVQASMTAVGIQPGDAVAQKDIQITP